MGEKPLRIWFDRTDAFVKIYDGIRYLVLFNQGWYDEIFDRIRYLISEKSGITDKNNFTRIGIDIILYLLERYCLFIML